MQVAAVAGLVALGAALLEGDRDIAVFLALMAYLAVWAAQAVDAHRRAVLLGSPNEGAIQILVLAPVAIAAFTLFWLVAGSGGTPAAVLQRYVSAWRQDQAVAARELFETPPAAPELDARWSTQADYLAARLTALRGSLGTASGIDPAQPWTSLLFRPEVTPAGREATAPGAEAVIGIDVVRQVTVPGSFFGLFPTASQESRPVERIGAVRLRAVPREPVLGVAGGIVWRIVSVDVPAT
jgi:hypothetical protein